MDAVEGADEFCVASSLMDRQGVPIQAQFYTGAGMKGFIGVAVYGAITVSLEGYSVLQEFNLFFAVGLEYGL